MYSIFLGVCIDETLISWIIPEDNPIANNPALSATKQAHLAYFMQRFPVSLH